MYQAYKNLKFYRLTKAFHKLSEIMNRLYSKLIKRIFDFVLSFLAIILFIPVIILIMILLTLSLKGNPFIMQTRVGKNCKLFKIIKFRTMTNERDLNGELKEDKDRLTKTGKIIRSLSLDEIPQFINILFGKMSLIGPRPLLVEYIPLYNSEQIKRHNVLPGITGWAQVNGRNAISWEEKFKLDLYYVQNISFLLDIKIILLTLYKVLKRDDVSSATSVTMEKFKGTHE